MVDGGASYGTAGGAGGGLKGLTNRTRSKPGTQTSGYKFGIGQDGYGVGSSNGVAGSGGGYYGGTTSDYADNCEAGAGGSSFVSGYDGCEAILEESTENNIIHSGQKIHYSKKEFQNIKFLNGNEQKNNNIDGYASIIYLSNNYKLALILDN
uniref:glycine-rich protein n=1 Tax=Methanobrevibacter smithii TaxID=2173 RepID=UPI00384F106C